MIPHWRKIGLIECPNCNWKVERTHYSCPNCGYTLPSILKKKVYSDSENNPDNNPNFEQLKIGTPSKYIDGSYKNELKYSDALFKLILNYNQSSFTRDFLMDNLDKIVDKANSNFIKHEKQNILTEFKKDLNNFNGFITNDDIKKFQEKYNKEYYNYFYFLNFTSLIKEKNEITINQEKEKVLNDFNEKLNKSNKVISDSERENFKNDYNKEYFKFYDELSLDQIIDEYNENFIQKSKILNTKGYFSQQDNYEFSIDDVIYKIDCNLFNGEPSYVDTLIKKLEEYESSIIDIILTDLDDEERIKLINKIREDISKEKISGNIDDIIDFYYEQYLSIKKQFNLNNFLNDYLKGDEFFKLVKLYDSYSDEMIFSIIQHVQKDISEDDSMDEDRVILKIDYYFKVESTKNDYFVQIDKIRDNSDYYISKYNLTDDEFEDILNYIQTKITEGYHIKNIKNCLENKIREVVDENRNESHIKLKRFLNDQKFIDGNNISKEKLDKLNEDVGHLIYKNKVRSDEIDEEFLLKRIR